ncbi:hypothetical protein L7F22_009529 [Adiantum nelumboides]|nr:hypothetical protein [Adiantum nelumboides]
MFNAHINVKVCSTIQAVKYVNKNIYKGHDRAIVRFYPAQDDGQMQHVDEINMYLDGCYVFASVACWRIFEFPLHSNALDVQRLSDHVPLSQMVTFQDHDRLDDILQRDTLEKTILIEWFECNVENLEANDTLYIDCPQKWVWNSYSKKWTRRHHGDTNDMDNNVDNVAVESKFEAIDSTPQRMANVCAAKQCACSLSSSFIDAAHANFNTEILTMIKNYFLRSEISKLEALVIAGGKNAYVNAHGLPGLLRAANSKVWYLQIETFDLSRESVEALQHSKVTHLKVKSVAEEYNVSASPLANYVGSAHCRLESFECEQELRCSNAELLITALQSNYQSRLRSLRLIGHSHDQALNLAQRCEHIVQRNALFLASTQPPFVAATSAKLFICGHSGAGKTTMARNFNRRFTLPTALQRHSTTQGIAMRGVLAYNGKQAVICGIAGQEEFHAFNHYIVKGSQTKVITDAGHDNSNMEHDVRYWLRLISSHKTLASQRKPKVLIALKYHGSNGHFSKTFVEHINNLASQYTGLLDIHKDGGGNMCFEVVALQVASLKQIKHAVGVALEDVLATHPLVLSLCKKVRDSVRLDKSKNGLWSFRERKTQKKRVGTIEELTETVLSGNDENKAARISAVKFTMACMHDMGESLYFGVDYKTDPILVNSATLDMQWFVQELVGIFIQVFRDDDWSWNKRKHEQRQIQRRQDDYKVSMIRIVPMIEEMCSPNQVGYVLTALHKMGVLLPSDDNWNGAWSRTHPKQVIVPALLQNEVN